jgi:NADH oxidase (H2O2-forming)
MGKETLIIARANQILRRFFNQKPAALLESELKKHGIQLLVNEKIEEILGKDKVEGVKTNRREVLCDTVILTTGMKPRVELAVLLDLEIGRMGGILVDDKMKTSQEDVFACGDCIESRNAVTLNKELSMFWHNAAMQGETAGINSVGGTRRYAGSLNLINIDVFGKSASALGLTTDNPEEVIESYEEKTNQYLKIALKNERIIGVQTINKIQLMPLILNLALKKINVRGFPKILEKRKFLTVSPEYIRLEQFLRSGTKEKCSIGKRENE